MVDNSCTDIVEKQFPSPPMMVYKPLKFWFNTTAQPMALPYSSNDFLAMQTRTIEPTEISPNHEFYEEFADLFSSCPPPYYVPVEFPRISSFLEVTQANNIVGPLELDGHPIRITHTPGGKSITTSIGLFYEEHGNWVFVPPKPEHQNPEQLKIRLGLNRVPPPRASPD